MQQEFFEGCKIGFILHLWAVQESGPVQTLESSMDLGGAQPEIRCDDRHWGAFALVAAEFQNHHDVLRL
jgi:hypothetical protein